MRKIIGFKLTPRPKEVLRRLKKTKFDLSALGGEQALEVMLQRAEEALSPAVLFDSYGPGDLDAPQLSPMTGVAYSVVLATLGKDFSALRSTIDEQEPDKSPVFAVIQDVLIEDSVRFASSLLDQEAANEACELGPLNILTGAEALEPVIRQLDGAKIGVTLSEGNLVPAASSAVSLSWLVKSKAKTRGKARS